MDGALRVWGVLVFVCWCGVVNLGRRRSRLEREILSVVGALFSQRFVMTFLLALLYSLTNSFLNNLPCLSMVNTLMVTLVLKVLVRLTRPTITCDRPKVNLVSGGFLQLNVVLLKFGLGLVTLTRTNVGAVLLTIMVISKAVLLICSLTQHFNISHRLTVLITDKAKVYNTTTMVKVSSRFSGTTDRARTRHRHRGGIITITVITVLKALFALLRVNVGPLLRVSTIRFNIVANNSLRRVTRTMTTNDTNNPIDLSATVVAGLSQILVLTPTTVVVN